MYWRLEVVRFRNLQEGEPYPAYTGSSGSPSQAGQQLMAHQWWASRTVLACEGRIGSIPGARSAEGGGGDRTAHLPKKRVPRRPLEAVGAQPIPEHRVYQTCSSQIVSSLCSALYGNSRWYEGSGQKKGPPLASAIMSSYCKDNMDFVTTGHLPF